MHKLNPFIGVEKNNDIMKNIFFRNSNKYDAAKDLLVNQFYLHELQNYDRIPGKYT